MKSLDDYLTEKLSALKNSNDPIETAVCEDDYRLGAKACLTHLMERGGAEINWSDTGIWNIPIDDGDGELITELTEYKTDRGEDFKGPRRVQVVEMEWAEKLFAQLSAKLAARDLEIEELRKINAENARAHTQSARDQILLGQGFVRVKYVPLEEIYKDEAHTGGGEHE